MRLPKSGPVVLSGDMADQMPNWNAKRAPSFNFNVEQSVLSMQETQAFMAAGHSFGAYTVMALAGATVQLTSLGARAYPDAPIKAFVAISPQGPDEQFRDYAWKNISDPVMTISGSRDRGVAGESPEWRRIAYDSMPAGDKYLVYVHGATHMAFALPSELTETVPGSGMPSAQEIVKVAALAFFNAYLLQNTANETDLKQQFAQDWRGSVEFKVK